MHIERGFQRLLSVLSITVLIVVVGVDVWNVPPLPRAVRVTLGDGRQVTLQGDHVEKGRLGLMLDLGESLTTPEGRGVLAATISALPDLRVARDTVRSAKIGIIPPPPDSFVPDPVQAGDIREITVFRPVGRWLWLWRQANLSILATGFVVVLWLAFPSIRWIARGFIG